jgi:hypothetical protein
MKSVPEGEFLRNTILSRNNFITLSSHEIPKKNRHENTDANLAEHYFHECDRHDELS